MVLLYKENYTQQNISSLLLSSGPLRNSLRQEPDAEEIFRMIPLPSTTVVGIGCMSDRATIVKNGVLNNNTKINS